MDVVLDHTFQQLELNLPPSSVTDADENYLIQLVETVARHCPSLHSFSLSTRCNLDSNYARSFSKFNNLAILELCLGYSDVSIFTEFLTYLGSSCPKLKKLKLESWSEKFLFGFDQQLAFILGEKVKVIPYDVMEDLRNGFRLLHRLQFNSEDIPPFCSTLQSLEVRVIATKVKVYSGHGIGVSSVAFMLRHLPCLKKLVIGWGHSDVDLAVRLLQLTLDLHGDLRETSNVIEMSRRVINGKFFSGRLRWTTNCPPARKNLHQLLIVLF